MTDPDLPPAPSPDSAPPAGSLDLAQDTSSKLTRVEILGAALAVAGAAALTFTVMAARGMPETEAAAIRSAVIPAHRPGPVPAARAVGGAPGWAANRPRRIGNAAKSMAFELPADDRVSIWMRDVRPLLVVRCLRGAVDAFVYTDSAATMEAHTEDHTVRFGFDDGPETRELWPDSAEHDALFAPDGEAFARRVMTATTLRFVFTPHNAAPATVHFRVNGLRDMVEIRRQKTGDGRQGDSCFQ